MEQTDNVPMEKEHENVYWNSFLPVFLDRMGSYMRKHMTSCVENYGLSSAHAVYLIALRLQGPMTQRQMSKFVDMDVANTNRIIKVLKEKGMVYDDRISENSKSFKVRLTLIGEKLADEVMNSTSKWMDGIMDVATEDEVYNMRSTLLKILKSMDPDLERYMSSKHQDLYYTYLGFNAEDEDFIEPRIPK